MIWSKNTPLTNTNLKRLLVVFQKRLHSIHSNKHDFLYVTSYNTTYKNKNFVLAVLMTNVLNNVRSIYAFFRQDLEV